MRAIKGLHFAGYRKSSPMLPAGAAMAALIGLPPAGQAQASSATDSSSLNEIVVTANKLNAQKVLDIPVSIQAISGDALQAAGAPGIMRNAGDLPGLSIQDLGPGDKKYVI